MPATGRVLHHDPASRNFEAPRRITRPMSWLHSTAAPVLNQADLSGCTGWSAATLLNHAMFAAARARFWGQFTGRHGRSYLGDDQGKYLYASATRNDPFDWTYPPTDDGSSGLGVGKALKAMGVITDYLWTFDWANALAQAQHQPVLLGTIWTQPMFEPDARGVIRIGSPADLKKAADDGEGHEYCWRGMNLRTGYCRIRNQWTRQWGLAGEAFIHVDELRTLVMDYQGDVLLVPR